MEQTNNKKVFAVFVAGGNGTRMGASIPKQFLELNGHPVLYHTVKRFTEALPDAEVIVVLPREHFETWKLLCREHQLDCKQILVPGGISRFHSVKNALEYVPDGAIVMIHDGVRPNISASLLRKMVLEANDTAALIPVVPVVDSLRSKDTLSIVDRSQVVAVQTPQVFDSTILKDAYTQPFDNAFTDDASVVCKKNVPLTYIEGERYNIKITTPDDLRVVSLLMKQD